MISRAASRTSSEAPAPFSVPSITAFSFSRVRSDAGILSIGVLLSQRPAQYRSSLIANQARVHPNPFPSKLRTSPDRACRIRVSAFPQRSPPRLLPAAACGGLRSAPDHRTRRALLHLSYSCAPQITYAALVTHGPTRTFGLSTTERYEHLLDSVNRSYRSAEWSSKPGRASSRNLRREDGAMRRRELLAALAAQLLVVPLLDRLRAVAAIPPRGGWSRVRPGDPNWPSPTEWDGLRQRVGGRLIAVQLPLQPRREAPIGEACRIDTGAMAVPIAGVRFGHSTTRRRGGRRPPSREDAA